MYASTISLKHTTCNDVYKILCQNPFPCILIMPKKEGENHLKNSLHIIQFELSLTQVLWIYTLIITHLQNLVHQIFPLILTMHIWVFGHSSDGSAFPASLTNMKAIINIYLTIKGDITIWSNQMI